MGGVAVRFDLYGIQILRGTLSRQLLNLGTAGGSTHIALAHVQVAAACQALVVVVVSSCP